MFWIDTQRRWCTLTSYNYLGQFNNFNKLRQYDWSNFWCMFLYIQLLLRKIYFIRRKEVIGLLYSHVSILLGFQFQEIKNYKT